MNATLVVVHKCRWRRHRSLVPYPVMPAKGKPRPAQRPPAGKPASPLSKGGPRGVAAIPPPFARGDRRGVGARPSSLLDTRIIYCGDCFDQLRKLPDACVDLIYIDPPFNSNRNYEVFWGETKEKRAFEDRHAGPQPVRSILDLHFPLQCRGGSSPSRSE